LRRKSTAVPKEKAVDRDARRREVEILAALALERPQLEAVATWMAELARRTLRVEGGDDDR
jgi:arginine deiminase